MGEADDICRLYCVHYSNITLRMKSFNVAVVLRSSEGQVGSVVNYTVVPFAGNVDGLLHQAYRCCEGEFVPDCGKMLSRIVSKKKYHNSIVKIVYNYMQYSRI